MNKRKHPGPSKSLAGGLTEQEQIIYEAVRSKESSGTWKGELRTLTGLGEAVINKTLKSLLTKQRIKEVANIQRRNGKHYMAIEFEPSEELSGGTWYSEGQLDITFINDLKNGCLRLMLGPRKVATLEDFFDICSKISQVQLTKKQVEEVVSSLVLDNKLVQTKSQGTGEFLRIPVGEVCYTRKNKKDELKVGALASIPCGVCPQIRLCTPDGIISPSRCEYYKKWLEF